MPRRGLAGAPWGGTCLARAARVPSLAPGALARAALAASVLLLAGCASEGPSPPRRTCELRVWYQPRSLGARVELRGSWDGFAYPGRALPPGRADGWRVTGLVLPPGPVSYALVEDGAWQPPDPRVGTSRFFGEREVALTTVPDCGAPALAVTATDTAEAGLGGARAQVSLAFTAAVDGAPLDVASVAVERLRDGAPVPVEMGAYEGATGAFSLRTAPLPPGKHVWRVRARDTLGRAAEPARLTLWSEPASPAVGAAPGGEPTGALPPAPLHINPRDPRDYVIYQVLVDRFRDDRGEALAPPLLPSERAGGRLAGLRRAVASGELSALGFNALWLHPLGRTPQGRFLDLPGQWATGYHGYWPSAPRELEPRLGDEAELRALVDAAHARGMRVLLDVVPNHVHAEHPWVAAHLEDGWFNRPAGDCLCGATCSWTTEVEACWFTAFLPDLDWRRDEVALAMTEDVASWVEGYALDGVRVDAVPMMPRAATRRLAARLHALDHPGHRTYLLGENFVGPAGFADLRYYLGPFGLDGEFHFPLLWTLRATLAEGRGSLRELHQTVAAGEEAFRGAGAVMGLTLGNHDVPRFASVADGSALGEGPAPPLRSALVHGRQALAFGVLYLLPGAPVVQWGDEVGVVGRGDPDNRRVLPAEGELTAPARALRGAVATLGRLRACSPALRRGAYRLLAADDERWVFARELEGERVVVALQRSAAAEGPALASLLPAEDAAALSLGLWLEAEPTLGVTQRGPLAVPATDAPAGLTLPSAPLSLRVFVSRGSPCLAP